jgi:hypothetical protein
MPAKAIDNSATGCLILIVPTAFLLAFLFVAWPVLLALVVGSAGWNMWQYYQWQQLSKQINPIFNQLIQINLGRVTVVDLAMKANLPGEIAKRYLDTKTKEFAARTREYEDIGTVYYFITVSTLGSIFDESEPPKEPKGELPASNAPEILEPLPWVGQDRTQSLTSAKEEVEPPIKNQTASQFIIQSELAKRLDVHSSTVYKRRSEPDFPAWTRNRDPDGIAWAFSPETKEFYPLEPLPKENS